MAKRRDEPKEAAEPAVNFSGIALTTVGSKDNDFSNYRMCVLFIVEGQIVHIEKSQEFALFEAIARHEIVLDRAHFNLSTNYKPGSFLRLGKEDRDKLVNRLKKDDPELLSKIAPALGLPA